MTGGWGTPRYTPEAPKVPNRAQIAEQLGVGVEDIPRVSRVLSFGPDKNGMGWIEVVKETATADARIAQDELGADVRPTTTPEVPSPQTGVQRGEDSPHEGRVDPG